MSGLPNCSQPGSFYPTSKLPPAEISFPLLLPLAENLVINEEEEEESSDFLPQAAEALRLGKVLPYCHCPEEAPFLTNFHDSFLKGLPLEFSSLQETLTTQSWLYVTYSYEIIQLPLQTYARQFREAFKVFRTHPQVKRFYFVSIRHIDVKHIS